MARHRIPKEIKEAKGTLRKCRENNLAPVFDKTTPVAPDDLSSRAKFYFNQLCQRLDEANILTVADVFCISQLAELMEREDILKKELKSFGGYSTTTVTKQGSDMPRLYPHLAALNDIARIKISYLAKLGLTPSDRNNVSQIQKDKQTEDNPLNRFD